MLRDPVERVRLATAQVIAQHGNPAALEILETMIADPNEVEAVKKSILKGLGLSQSTKSFEVLAEILDTSEELEKDASGALSLRTAKKDILQLIEIFKKATPVLREKLVTVFKNMGDEAEPEILELLKSEVASLKPFLAQILDQNGGIEHMIRKLSDKNVKVRRDAALWLSLLGTLPAFRGLVMASKDPDHEVRAIVVKALEKFSEPQGKQILQQLKEDPDSRIRKYTNWVLERIDTLAKE